MKQLEQEREFSTEMENMFQKSLFNINNIKGNPKLLKFYAGFPNYEIFCMVLSFLGREAASQLIYSNIEQKDAQKKRKGRPQKDLVSGGRIFPCIMSLQSWSTSGGFSCKI